MSDLKFVALARVSSREQEREGFSLEVQEAALRAYAAKQGGVIDRMYRIAETASKRQERKVFQEMLAYTQAHAAELGGVLFYKVDRAARNLPDYVEVERLESDFGVRVHYIAQPSENTPAGRLQRRMLSNMASFFTEQQGVDIREGMLRRVQSGLFAGYAPYGYKNVRVNGRGMVSTEPEEAAIVRQIFEWYAQGRVTMEMVRDRLYQAEMYFSRAQRKFTRTKLYDILHDRSYIGEVPYHGRWYPGVQEPIVTREVFERVQALMRGRGNRALDLVYSGTLITCGHCGRAVTGERITKRLARSGAVAQYVYYRCVGYTAAGHPRVRVPEAALDAQVLALFGRLRMDEGDRAWASKMLRRRQAATHAATEDTIARAQQELQRARRESETLFQMRLAEEVGPEKFREKNAEIEQRIARLELTVATAQKDEAEAKDLALRVFELSQTLTEKWLSADSLVKRRLLDLVSLNYRLDGETLVFTLREPFGMLEDGGFGKVVEVTATGIELIERFRRGCGPLRGLVDRVAA
jgi:site-specific DNA recombinase